MSAQPATPEYYLGIDLGQYGGLAVVDASGSLRTLFKMPTRKRVIGGSTKNEIHVCEIRRLLTDAGYLEGDTFMFSRVGIEAVHSFGNEQRSSLWTFGRGVGKVQSFLELYGHLDFLEVAPIVWQQEILGKITSDKSVAVAWCKARWPSFASDHDGLSDAACIAEYTRRFSLKQTSIQQKQPEEKKPKPKGRGGKR